MSPELCGMCGAADCKYSICETWDLYPEEFVHLVPLCEACVTGVFGAYIEAQRKEQERRTAEAMAESIEHEKAMRVYLKAKAKENRANFMKRKAELESALQKAYGES
jgi:hypothetical protein